ncbi:hypothetical protein LTR53_009111 [Teratosphaeriaceae sp. CCFEE 6253]|nr:hypothetical protein LTR53_009111 [Teratosphaeriaceae sp. CCFEE 6253]
MPRRLPFVVNSLFEAALVIGLAHFGDLNQVLPLKHSLDTAYELLSQYTQDAIAQRAVSIVGYVREACTIYLDRCSKDDMEYYSLAIGRMFGQIHCQPSGASTRAQTPTSGNTAVLDVAPGSVLGEELVRNGRAIATKDMNRTCAFDDVGGFLDAAISFANFTPQTLHFDMYDEHTSLFSTIGLDIRPISGLGHNSCEKRLSHAGEDFWVMNASSRSKAPRSWVAAMLMA